jgi:hypothetical protein
VIRLEKLSSKIKRGEHTEDKTHVIVEERIVQWKLLFPYERVKPLHLERVYDDRKNKCSAEEEHVKERF